MVHCHYINDLYARISWWFCNVTKRDEIPSGTQRGEERSSLNYMVALGDCPGLKRDRSLVTSLQPCSPRSKTSFL
jgi:hypothetical protein